MNLGQVGSWGEIAESEVEQLAHKLVSTWDANIAGGGFTSCDKMLIQ